MNSSNATALPSTRRSLPGPFHGPTLTSAAETAWPRSDERTSGHSLPRWRRRSSHFAQQMRSNSALRTHTNHQVPPFLLWCYGLLREGSWWALWRGSLDGMQGVRGSNPLSSTPGHRPSPPSAIRESPGSGSKSAAICPERAIQRPVRRCRRPTWLASSPVDPGAPGRGRRLSTARSIDHRLAS